MSENDDRPRGGLIYGGPPPPEDDDDAPSTEDQQAAAAMFQAAVAETANQLLKFFPGASDKELIENASRALLETPKLQPVLMDAAAASPMLLTHPAWGWQLHKLKNGQRVSSVGHIVAPKDIKLVHSASDVTHWATCLAFITSPTARAALRLMGYDIEFVQSTKLPRSIITG